MAGHDTTSLDLMHNSEPWLSRFMTNYLREDAIAVFEGDATARHWFWRYRYLALSDATRAIKFARDAVLRATSQERTAPDHCSSVRAVRSTHYPLRLYAAVARC